MRAIQLFEYINNDIIKLRDYLNMDINSKINSLPIHFPLEFWGFMEDLVNEKEEMRQLKEKIYNETKVFNNISDVISFVKQKYPKLYKSFSMYLYDVLYDKSRRYENYMTIDYPSWYMLSKPTLIKNQWMIHFTDNAMAVAKEGFKYGMGDMSRLCITTERGKSEKKGGYNFAYLLSDYLEYGDVNNKQHPNFGDSDMYNKEEEEYWDSFIFNRERLKNDINNGRLKKHIYNDTQDYQQFDNNYDEYDVFRTLYDKEYVKKYLDKRTKINYNGETSTIENDEKNDETNITTDENANKRAINRTYANNRRQEYRQNPPKWLYGSEAVIFRASGIRVYHRTEHEFEAIFDGKTATDIIPILPYRGGYCVVDKKNKFKVLFEDADINVVVNWAMNNYDQYRKII